MSLGRVVGNRGRRHTFSIYDTSSYEDDNDDKPWFLRMGTHPARTNIKFGGAIFPPPDDNTELPVEATFRALAAGITGEPIFIIDLESYPTAPSDTDEDIEASVAKLVTVAGWAKDERPDLAVGYYDLCPIRDFWASVAATSHADYIEWQRQNDLFQPLVDAVDFLAPSLYTFYPQAQGSGLHWSTYITEHVSEARRLAPGKPVYPFIWPQYHQGGTYADLRFMESAYFRDQLDLLAELADGVMFWGSRLVLPPGGMSYDGWWPEMQEFISG